MPSGKRKEAKLFQHLRRDAMSKPIREPGLMPKNVDKMAMGAAKNKMDAKK